jgi:hypothetical protein
MESARSLCSFGNWIRVIMSPLTLWLWIVLLIGAGTASDIPFVFDETTSSVADYSSSQIEEAHIASSHLAGVPAVTPVTEDEVLDFPITGGGTLPERSIKKNVSELKKTLDAAVEPDNPRVHEEAVVLALKYPGDLTIDQIDSIYNYIKYGDSSKRGWGYVRDPRGLDYFNYANMSLKAGDRANCVGGGDCDDFAILMAALVESIGGTTRIILARNNTTGGHAYTEVYLGQLNATGSQVETIINWLKQTYETDKIYTHIDTDTKDVWLNLDWGPDERGNAHPGGPFFQGDKHIVLCLRDEYEKTPLKAPENSKTVTTKEVNSEAMIPSTQGTGTNGMKVSGTGSIKKEYFILNKANDYAKVSIDIKNATRYEYQYNNYSDETQCNVDLKLNVSQAESVICSGNAKNRNGIPTNMTTSIKNGNLTYNNSVQASENGVRLSQYLEYDSSKGDSVETISTAALNSNIYKRTLKNTIFSNSCEHIQFIQENSIGEDTNTYANINAITGPFKSSLSISEGDRELYANADVTAGVMSLEQGVNLCDNIWKSINSYEARQSCKGVLGGATFYTGSVNPDNEEMRAYTVVGSGNIMKMQQLANWFYAFYDVDYEYMPISYQTGEYDIDINTSSIQYP